MAIRTSIRKIGNSKGVILPAAVLEEVGAAESLLLSVEHGRIILEAIRKPREGWFDQASSLQASPSELEWERASLSDDSEWVWD